MYINAVFGQQFEPYFKSFIEIVQNNLLYVNYLKLPKRRNMIMTTSSGKKKNYIIFLSHCFDIFSSQITANKFIMYLVREKDLPQCHLELVHSWPV